MWIWRALEWTGIGAAGGCAIALLVLPVLVGRGVAATGPVLALLGIGAAAGLLAAVTQRRSLDAAAVEADRQLELHDLLATAWAVRGRGDAWAGTVLALAEARCADLAPGQVVLKRLGVRSWAGIAAAVMLTVSAAMIYSTPRQSMASDSPFVSAERLERELDRLSDSHVRLPRVSQAPTGAADPASRQFDTGRNERTERNGESAGASDGSQQAPAAGVGTGEASPERVRMPNAAIQQSRAGETAPDQIGTTESADAASGGGSGDGRATGGDAPATGMNTATAAGTRVPAWRSDQWPAARDEAMTAIRNGAIPPDYRALVQDYFDRE